MAKSKIVLLIVAIDMIAFLIALIYAASVFQLARASLSPLAVGIVTTHGLMFSMNLVPPLIFALELSADAHFAIALSILLTFAFLALVSGVALISSFRMGRYSQAVLATVSIIQLFVLFIRTINNAQYYHSAYKIEGMLLNGVFLLINFCMLLFVWYTPGKGTAWEKGTAM